MKTSALSGPPALTAAGTLLFLLVAGPVAAESPPAHSSTAPEKQPEPTDEEDMAERGLNPNSRSEEHILPGWQLGVVGSFSATFANEEETDLEGGVGVMLDHFLIDNVLEIGGSVRLLQGMHTSVSFEALVDVPYHITPHSEIYAGLGGVALVAIDAENRFGGTAAFGFHGWFDHRYGFVVELAYSLLSGEEIGHEVGISVGPLIEL